MKKKISKALSVLLAIIVALSVFTCVLGVTSAATEVSYYVGTVTGTSPDGTQTNPYASVSDAVTAANTAGQLKSGDTLNILALSGAAWGTKLTPEHKYNLVVKSNDTANKVTISDLAMIYLGGPTTLDDINISTGTGSGARFFLNGYDFTLADGASISTYRFYAGSDRKSVTVGGQTVVIDGSLYAKQRMVIGGESKALTYTDYLELVINDSSNTHTVLFYHGATKFADMRIDLKATGGITFESGATSDFSTATLQFINSTTTAYEATHAAFSGITTKWILNNNLGIAGLLSFTDTNGKFAIASGYANVRATDGTNTVNAANNALTLNAGVYSITADKVAVNQTCYVKAGATNGDGTKEKPFANVCEAIAAGSNAGLVGGDVLTVKLLGTDNIDWGTATGHIFKLVVVSDDTANKSTLVIPDCTSLMGKTEFDNVILKSTVSSSTLRFNYNDITIGAGVESSIRNLTLGNYRTAATVGDVNYVFNYPFTGNSIWIGNEFYDTNNGGDINILVNNSSSNINFIVTTRNGASTYQNVNINAKKATAISFGKAGTGTIDVKGVFQILNSSPNAVHADVGAMADIADSKKYILNNISGDSELLEFTDTVGKYKVTSQYDVYAVKEGTTERITPTDGYLVLAAGEYTVAVDRDPIVKEYYVSSSGVAVETGTRPADVGTKEKPVLTVADATRLIAQDSLSVTDTAKIIINAGDTVYWGSSAERCSPLLKIQSSLEGVQATLTNKTSYSLVGNTEFKDVIVELTNKYQILRFNNYDVTFDTGSQFTSNSYICLGTMRASTVDNDITVTLKGKVNPRLFTLTSEAGSSTYNGDINIIVDGDETVFSPSFAGAANTTTTYNGNINIRVLNARTMLLTESARENADVDFNGSLTLLAEESVDFPYELKSNFSGFDVAGGKWYITNYSGTPDLVEVSDTAGTFNVKEGKTVYVRDEDSENESKYTEGTITLPSGRYMISDKNTPKVVDDSHKMLHFRSNGAGRNYVYASTPITPGETYIYECSYYTLEDASVAIRRGDGNRAELTIPTIISDTVVNNYHKVVAEFTVPEDYTASGESYIGLSVGKYNEGVLFDQVVYKKGDKSKTNLMNNNELHRGLDEWALTTSFWGAHYAGDSGGVGILRYEIDPELLAVIDYDLSFIDELIASGNPQDGKWWNEGDIHEEVMYTAYTTAKGTFKDENGEPISGAKFVLVSSEGKSYTATTNSKGVFDFGKVVVNFYDLYLLDSDGKKVHTGYSAYLDENTAYVFEVVSDMSGLASEDVGDSESDGVSVGYTEENITVEPGEETVETVPSGALSGTVYTPMREVVPGLRLVIDGVGEVTTDENGAFAFASVPVGTYELYTVLSGGEKYVLTEITIVENNELALKLKYDPPTVKTDVEADNGWIIWVVIASVIALVVVGALVVILIVKKKKK